MPSNCGYLRIPYKPLAKYRFGSWRSPVAIIFGFRNRSWGTPCPSSLMGVGWEREKLLNHSFWTLWWTSLSFGFVSAILGVPTGNSEPVARGSVLHALFQNMAQKTILSRDLCWASHKPRCTQAAWQAWAEVVSARPSGVFRRGVPLKSL